MEFKQMYWFFLFIKKNNFWHWSKEHGQSFKMESEKVTLESEI